MSELQPPARGERVSAEIKGWLVTIDGCTAGDLNIDTVPPDTVVYLAGVGLEDGVCASLLTRSFRAAEMWCHDTAYTLEQERREVTDG